MLRNTDLEKYPKKNSKSLCNNVFDFRESSCNRKHFYWTVLDFACHPFIAVTTDFNLTLLCVQCWQLIAENFNLGTEILTSKYRITAIN